MHESPSTENLGREATELATALIRVDTSSPPGNETAAATVLRDWLAARGIESELVGPDPDRLNLVATLAGTGEAPSLGLSGHLDVVPTGPAEAWTYPPFSGHVDPAGILWGRGAVDMKAQVATRAVAFAAPAQSGIAQRGTVRLIAQADEEANTADVGMSWLVRERPDLRVDCAVEEGGGRRMTLADGRVVVTCG
ncbi:MAG: M20/M25/M40 family metallo-hydrolase, partial [Thermoleophilia bacterium]|nr:M20/M25/M40 family metallo-hydrolase [Thermoleophilia bacterium]